MRPPRRTPDFNKLYKTEQDFNAAFDDKEALSESMLKHSEGIETDPSITKFDFDRFDEAVRGDRPFSYDLSSRRIGQSILMSSRLKIVPSAHGRIENLLITVPWYRYEGQIYLEPIYARHYQTLIKNLRNNRKYTILCHPDHQDEVASWFSDLSNISLEFCLSPVFEYSIWAQDAYVGLKSPLGQSVLAEGVLFPRYDDMTIADDVAMQSSTSVQQSSLYFQGGNILGGPDYCLIGEDYVHRNETRIGTETRQKVLDAFKSTFGQDIITLGGRKSACYDLLRDGVLSGYGQQPLFHIDMYVTPTGVTGESGKEIVFLGRPKEAKVTTGRYSEEDDHNNARLDSFFEETESQLSEHFEVRHLPLMLTYGNLNSDWEPVFYWLTFNNVVLENTGTEKNVVMTTYSQDSQDYGTDEGLRRELEAAAEAAWRSIDYTVLRMDGLEELATGSGSIHCITKALDRAALIS